MARRSPAVADNGNSNGNGNGTLVHAASGKKKSKAVVAAASPTTSASFFTPVNTFAVVATLWAWGVLELTLYVLPMRNGLLRFVFLTIWQLYAQAAYYTLRAVCAALTWWYRRSNSSTSRAVDDGPVWLMYVRDKFVPMCASSVWIVSFGVTLVFWPIFFYDPSLLIPPAMQAIFPLWLNVFQHAVPFAIAMFDVIVFPQVPRLAMRVAAEDNADANNADASSPKFTTVISKNTLDGPARTLLELDAVLAMPLLYELLLFYLLFMTERQLPYRFLQLLSVRDFVAFCAFMLALCVIIYSRVYTPLRSYTVQWYKQRHHVHVHRE